MTRKAPVTALSFDPRTGKINGEDIGDGKVKDARKAGKKRLYLLGEGYPWYGITDRPGTWSGYQSVQLNDGPNSSGKPKTLNYRWGAWQKVKLWIERVG